MVETKEKIIQTPKEMFNELCQYVIGQEEAKKTLCVAMYNHYKRVIYNLMNADDEDSDLKDVIIDKSNVLLIGNTGTGKTYMIKNIAKMLHVPCYVADATKLTQSGYVGDDVESILVGLLQECNYNVELAQRGIIVLDEFDKLSRKSDNPSITRDVGGEGVQQSLLKIVEGSKVGVPPMGGRKHPEQPLIYVDTTNILFIGMGAFDGLQNIIEHRLNTKKIGFIQQTEKDEINNDIYGYTTSDDLKKFGLIPELIGRFPIVTYTNDLTKDDLIKILNFSKNSVIKQYQKLMKFDGIQLSFADDAISKIAEYTLSLKTGARGLRQVIERLLNDIMFEEVDGTVKNIVLTDRDVDSAMSKKYKKVA